MRGHGPQPWYRPLLSENCVFPINFRRQTIVVLLACRAGGRKLGSPGLPDSSGLRRPSTTPVACPPEVATANREECWCPGRRFRPRNLVVRVRVLSLPETPKAAVISFLISSLLLIALVAGGIALIVAIRGTVREPGVGRGDCDETREQQLAEYKNLRDRGVLSEAEYRSIKTSVDLSARTPLTTSSEPSAAAAERTTPEDWRN